MNVAGPEVEEYEGVVQIKYDSDGVLAVPEGTEYSRGEGEFEVADSNQILTVEDGSEIYIDSGSEFAAYDIEVFAKAIAENSGSTDIWDPNKTKIWHPGKRDENTQPGDSTKIFDPSEYDIGDPEEYTKMMKENADTILVELAERDVTGEEATQALDSIFQNMNETYDMFVHGSDRSASQEKTGIYEGSKTSDALEASKRKVSMDELEESLQKVEKALEEDEGSNGVDDYVDAEELLNDEQTEIHEFESESQELEGGQSEISDWG